MKKLVTLLLVLALCLSTSACVAVGTPGNSEDNKPSVDPLGEPVIVTDENDVERENRYDMHGNHIGYYQYTGGTNCGNYGKVLVEFLDLDGNVLNSFTPTLAGCTLGVGQHGSFDHGQFEITDIWESDYNQNGVTSNEYKIVPYSGGEIYSCIENRAGCTTKCDLYGTDGQVVATLTPTDPAHQLYIYNIFLYDDDYYADHFYVTEGFTEGDTLYTTRQLYYSMDGTLLGDFRLSTVPIPDTHRSNTLRIQCMDKDGQVQRVFKCSAEGASLSAYFDFQTKLLHVYEYLDMKCLLEEYCVPGTYQSLFRVQQVYQNGAYSHTEMEVCGGKVEVTEGSIQGTYTKLEFYDAAGVLQKTVEAPAAGGLLTAKWESDSNWCWIDIYDASGNKVGYDYYQPKN